MKLKRPDIVQAAAARSGLQQKQVAVAFDAIFGVISDMPEGSTALIHGFGLFERRVLPVRKGRDPRTGETINLRRKVKIVFRASEKSAQRD